MDGVEGLLGELFHLELFGKVPALGSHVFLPELGGSDLGGGLSLVELDDCQLLLLVVLVLVAKGLDDLDVLFLHFRVIRLVVIAMFGLLLVDLDDLHVSVLILLLLLLFLNLTLIHLFGILLEHFLELLIG